MEITERVLGIDFGKKRIGLAISDPLGMFATGLTTLEMASQKQSLMALLDIIQTHQIRRIVIGLPIRTTGEWGDMADAAKAFGDTLEAACGLPIIYEDERLTSQIAKQSLISQGVKPSRQKHLVDKTAAALILQQYLDKQSRLPNPNPPLP